MEEENDVRPELRGAPSIALNLVDYIDEINAKYFANGTKMKVHSFALAVGLQLGKRLERENWGGHTPGSQFSTYDGISGIIEIFRINGDLEDGVTPVLVASEYINGGLNWLREIGFETGSEDSFHQFTSAFPHLLKEE